MATDNAEFLRARQQAMEQMREMHRKSELKAPDFLRYPAENQPPKPSVQQRQNDALFSLPERLKKEPDLALLGGLLLLLWSENADRKLLMALLYILL